ncbi:hypothetical protein EC973_009296 [Apophysomyces ossiformis]|uniref:Endoplasmic reticulum junction formation protein lunapark n=1 Tax=Apophysomyces ossiformis TaxID=679940 RepID=A0A8H7EU70_9FUNG|nr:hypothetical protein EC973_009296 [Apophysomyces ossiformis]
MGQQEYQAILTIAAPIFLIPFGIYYIRQAAAWYYMRKQKNEETRLVALRAQQKLKVEELKKKTSYYTTKSLLERYDLSNKKEQEKSVDQLRQRKPASVPGTTRQTPPHKGQSQLQGPSTVASPVSPTVNSVIRPVNPPSSMASPPQRQWYDKLVDALVGEDGPETKYALICSYCFAHNGLVLPQEIEKIQYTCPVCKKFNPARQPSANTARSPSPATPVLPASPEPSGSPSREGSPAKEAKEDSKEGSPAEEQSLSAEALSKEEED